MKLMKQITKLKNNWSKINIIKKNNKILLKPNIILIKIIHITIIK